MGIVRFALRLPHTFYVLAALVVFLGATAVLSMPTDIFPEIDIPVVTITTVGHRIIRRSKRRLGEPGE
jgi:multidrug efflux pump subunit AcrB